MDLFISISPLQSNANTLSLWPLKIGATKYLPFIQFSFKWCALINTSFHLQIGCNVVSFGTVGKEWEQTTTDIILHINVTFASSALSIVLYLTGMYACWPVSVQTEWYTNHEMWRQVTFQRCCLLAVMTMIPGGHLNHASVQTLPTLAPNNDATYKQVYGIGCSYRRG